MQWQTRANPNEVGDRSAFLIMCICGALCSCNINSTGPDGDLVRYYDLKTLVRHQVELLDSIGPIVQKVAEINGRREQTSFKPDSTIWAEELDPLFRLDLNEPHLSDMYDVLDEQHGTIQYKSRDPGETRVDALQIRMSDDTTVVEHVSATIGDSNPLFSMRREVHFDFAILNGRHVLKSYFISGWQKMVLLDTNNIRVDCKIMFNPG